MKKDKDIKKIKKQIGRSILPPNKVIPDKKKQENKKKGRKKPTGSEFENK
jgi:hypothetical protein